MEGNTRELKSANDVEEEEIDASNGTIRPPNRWRDRNRQGSEPRRGRRRSETAAIFRALPARIRAMSVSASDCVRIKSRLPAIWGRNPHIRLYATMRGLNRSRRLKQKLVSKKTRFAYELYADIQLDMSSEARGHGPTLNPKQWFVAWSTS